MIRRILAIGLLFIGQLTYSQYQITIEARLLNQQTNAPVPYANIGFVNKSIGTVSNDNGAFTLIYDEDEISKKDLLQISALGFETIQVSPSQLERLLTNTNKILIKPQPLELDEVFISNEKRRPITLNAIENDGSAIGYWKDRNALGGEIATILDVKRKRTRLEKLSFEVLENRSDSLKIRVNVYNYKRGYPQDKILSKDIYHTIDIQTGEVEIDLSAFNILVDRDCVIGIELLQVYGQTIEFAIPGKMRSGTSYRRYVSKDKWIRNPLIGMCFQVEASVPIKKGETYIYEREKPERITVYWDASAEQSGRNISEEIKLLDNYLKAVAPVDVEVVVFGNSIRSRKEFSLDKGLSEAFRAHLKAVNFDGAVDFAEILKTNDFDSQTILLFTSGTSIFSPLEAEVYVPTFTISSSPYANKHQLQKAAYYADGHYIDLENVGQKEAIEFMTQEIQDEVDYSKIENERNVVQGKIFTASGPVQGAIIRRKNSFVEVQSDIDGFFDIEAEVGDELIANYLGMQQAEAKVLNPYNVAILLKPDGVLLDEVVLEGERREEENVESGFGQKDERSLGFSTETITADQIGPQYTNLADLLVGKFPGLQIVGLNVAYQTPLFIIRGGGGSLQVAYAMFDIDGILYSPGQDIPPVDPQNIETVTILKSIIATNRYGEMGRGGAILVKTKLLGGGEAEGLQSALVTGNDYTDEGVLFLSEKPQKTPEYLLALNQSTSFENAKRVYRELKKDISNKTIPFYLDASNYFMKWDKEFAFQVISNVAAIADQNPKALHALAFELEALGKNIQAQQIYEHMAVLRPNHEQPYRDMARMSTLNGQYDKAMSLYKLMLANAIEGVDFIGLNHTIENELLHLMAFHRSKVDYSDLPNDLRRADFKFDLRMVFEWNDPNAEFEIQFVNPNKKFFTWSHSRLDSEERLRQEIVQGYSTEEFIIDDADPGEWIINIKKLNEEPLENPTYLKYTVFKNFGLPDESKQIRVIKLYEQQRKVTLDKFLYE